MDLGQYLLLCTVSFGKTRCGIECFEVRMLVCLADILLYLGITASLEFYYIGVAGAGRPGLLCAQQFLARLLHGGADSAVLLRAL